MQARYSEFQELGTNWVAITSDKLENLRRMADRHRFSFKLLSDQGGKVADGYGVLWAERKGIPHNEPGVFVVRSDGTLIFLSIISGPWGRPPVGDVLKVVSSAAKKRVKEQGAASPSS